MATAYVAKPSETPTHADVDDMLVDTHTAEEAAAEEDLYTQLKTLQRQLEFYEIQVRDCSSSGALGGCPSLAPHRLPNFLALHPLASAFIAPHTQHSHSQR